MLADWIFCSRTSYQTEPADLPVSGKSLNLNCDANRVSGRAALLVAGRIPPSFLVLSLLPMSILGCGCLLKEVKMLVVGTSESRGQCLGTRAPTAMYLVRKAYHNLRPVDQAG